MAHYVVFWGCGLKDSREECDEDAVTEASSLCSFGNIFNFKTIWLEGEESDQCAVIKASSICSSGNLPNFGIIDSTLREGERFATAFLDTEHKIRIARALDDFAVEYVRLPIHAIETKNLRSQLRLADTLKRIELTSPAAFKQCSIKEKKESFSV